MLIRGAKNYELEKKARRVGSITVQEISVKSKLDFFSVSSIVSSMSILSDTTIKGLILRGQLVLEGIESEVGPNSYQFRAGRILPAGARDLKPLEWNSSAVAEEFVAHPGEMFWVRTRQEVSLSSEICAYWWQTNTLSSHGIMLVNMSMVEPGYRGYLACLFVNFGNNPVVITPNTTIAKLVFVKTDKPAENPYTSNVSKAQYDDKLRQISISAPQSFLRITDQARDLDT